MENIALYECLMLIQLPLPDNPKIGIMDPQKFIIEEEFSSFSSSLYPYDSLCSDSLLYTFTYRDLFCNCYYFTYNSTGWVLLIASRFPFMDLFQMILTKPMMMPDTTKPLDKFMAIKKLVSMLPNSLSMNIEIGDIQYSYRINPSKFTFRSFDPTYYFSPNVIKTIWKGLLTGTNILIVAKDASVASQACFAAFSLMSPFQYCGPYAVWLRPTDPRFIQLVDDNQSLKVIGTSCTYLEVGFDGIVIHVDSLKRSKSEISKTSLFSKVNNNILSLVSFTLDNMMITDPYSEITQRPITVNKLKKCASELTLDILPSFEEIELFTKTQTFQSFREKRDNRDQFRGSLLGASPEDCFSWRPFSDLATILAAFPKIRADFQGDIHLLAVLDSHERALKGMLSSASPQ